MMSVLLLLLCVRRQRNIDDGGSEDKKTQDGTVDVYGRPASRHGTGGWKAASFTLAVQVMTNLCFYGVSINLVIYLITIMHETNASAATNVANWNGVGYIAPLLAAFPTDAYLGRYYGAVLSSAVNLLGVVLVTLAASLSSFHPPQCSSKDLTCEHASAGQGAFLYAALYVMVLGAGGVQATLVPLGADQFDEEDDEERKQKSSYFNWMFQCNLAGSFIASTLFVYVQDNVSWGLGWGVACGAQFIATIVLVMGMRFYRHHNPGGNPLSRIAQVLVASARKRRVKLFNANDLYEVRETMSVIKGSRKIQHSTKFRFLDKAAIMTEKDQASGNLQTNPWHLCTVTQVEEVKFLLRVLPIFFTSIMYTACYSQLTTLFVQQGYTMDRSLGSFDIPAASLSVFESLSVFIWVLIFDSVLVPFLRKRTKNPRGISLLKRIGVGFLLSVLSMTLAALVEIRRLHLVRTYGLLDDTITPVPMRVFWVIPQYFVMGASEVFTYIGLLEFFYDQAPDAIRSLGISLSMLTMSLGYFLSSLLLTVVGRITGPQGSWIADNLNRGRLDLFYWLLTVMSCLNLLVYTLCARHYDYTVTQSPIESTIDEYEKEALPIIIRAGKEVESPSPLMEGSEHNSCNSRDPSHPQTQLYQYRTTYSRTFILA